jgi:hypothetical protein
MPNYKDGFANYNPHAENDAEHLFQETVQERVDKWRATQNELYQSLSANQEANPHDKQGCMKLLASVGKGRQALFLYTHVA